MSWRSFFIHPFECLQLKKADKKSHFKLKIKVKILKLKSTWIKFREHVNTETRRCATGQLGAHCDKWRSKILQLWCLPFYCQEFMIEFMIKVFGLNAKNFFVFPSALLFPDCGCCCFAFSLTHKHHATQKVCSHVVDRPFVLDCKYCSWMLHCYTANGCVLLFFNLLVQKRNHIQCRRCYLNIFW